jgi:hypothetical protein
MQPEQVFEACYMILQKDEGKRAAHCFCKSKKNTKTGEEGWSIIR